MSTLPQNSVRKKTKRRVESESLNVETESGGTADKDAFALGLKIAKTKL